ncbi:GlsB/YeaQ/YmgE family stress response membrane protein [Phragmitibacter flavus]|uniref:GlsB/YeaQ/YmgE family stress response membrane protein n=1 Tax=Phragmitibacter flavus TaxID=2576071 RepID=A0A5R8KFQ9_9BACT|nr:GlsB/YeaQ/YmgE family stress response membrane protein [Phragmitibacter flavus]TLD71138.1 GlsB/YeaQ/YmgE family stress response membrane protein [Phragmitibacter flavus]
MIYNVLAWMVLGLLAGAVAKFLMPGRDRGGCLVTSVIGIAGALLGGFIGREFFGFDLTSSSIVNWNNFGVATAGSFVLLLIFRLFRK